MSSPHNASQRTRGTRRFLVHYRSRAPVGVNVRPQCRPESRGDSLRMYCYHAIYEGSLACAH